MFTETNEAVILLVILIWVKLSENIFNFHPQNFALFLLGSIPLMNSSFPPHFLVTREGESRRVTKEDAPLL